MSRLAPVDFRADVVNATLLMGELDLALFNLATSRALDICFDIIDTWIHASHETLPCGVSLETVQGISALAVLVHDRIEAVGDLDATSYAALLTDEHTAILWRLTLSLYRRVGGTVTSCDAPAKPASYHNI